MMLNAFKIAYDGRMFHGSARQPRLRTVEGTVLERLRKMGAMDPANERGLRFASRTDKGVSALGNMVVADTLIDGEKVVRAMNGSHFHDGLWFLGWARVPSDIRPRHAISRWYRYAFPLPASLGPGQFVINEDGMRETADLFKGEHDFRNFSKVDKSDPGRSSMRTIDSIELTTLTVRLTTELIGGSNEAQLPFDPPMFQDVLLIDVRGQSFLWQMVRRIAAAIISVAMKVVPVSHVRDILENRQRYDLEVLRPENLILMDVDHGIEYELFKEMEDTLMRMQRDKGWPLINRGMFYGQLTYDILAPLFR